jgi:ketosteroid isomerase-like protein
MDTNDQAALTSVLRTLEHCWATLDFRTVRSLWDDTQPPLYLAEEAAGPWCSWEALEKYWADTSKLAKRNRVAIRDLRFHELGPQCASVFYEMHWDIELPDGKSIGGDNRVCVSFKRTTAGWKIVQYIEAPLAPILYMRQLYELNVTPAFKA